jgi:hypothetical protein
MCVTDEDVVEHTVYSPQQNCEQHPTKRNTCCAENEPNDAHGELISCITAVDAVYSLSA